MCLPQHLVRHATKQQTSNRAAAMGRQHEDIGTHLVRVSDGFPCRCAEPVAVTMAFASLKDLMARLNQRSARTGERASREGRCVGCRAANAPDSPTRAVTRVSYVGVAHSVSEPIRRSLIRDIASFERPDILVLMTRHAAK